MGKPKADTARKADNKLAVKKKAPQKAKKPVAKKAAGKDPNKPKRPPSAFFVFMEEFRKTYKEKNPKNKSVAVVGKAGGDKWKSLSDAEKAPYIAKAEKKKAEYNKVLAAYKKNKDSASAAPVAEEEDESDKSKSEVNDGEDDESGEEDDDGDEEDDE